MEHRLTSEDIDRIAVRTANLIAERLAAPPPPKQPEDAAPPARPAAPVKPRLAYTRQELCEQIGLSVVTIARLEQRGLLRPVLAVRRKIYSHAEVERFLAMASRTVRPL